MVPHKVDWLIRCSSRGNLIPKFCVYLAFVGRRHALSIVQELMYVANDIY